MVKMSEKCIRSRVRTHRISYNLSNDTFTYVYCVLIVSNSYSGLDELSENPKLFHRNTRNQSYGFVEILRRRLYD